MKRRLFFVLQRKQMYGREQHRTKNEQSPNALEKQGQGRDISETEHSQQTTRDE